jgi:phosphatidate cytidylyltransferase
MPYLIGLLFVFTLCKFASKGEVKDSFLPIFLATAGVVYIALPLSHLVLLKGMEQGKWWILFTLILIWSNDTFAYYTGKNLGKHKLCPKISPKKTIEGAVGGIFGGIIAALIFNYLKPLGVGNLELIIVALFIGGLSIMGDLIESTMKRGMGVKDSGSMIPGHGGLLDRIDSMIFVVPALYYYLLFSPPSL